MRQAISDKKKESNKSSKRASSMAELMARTKSSISSFRRGDVVKGKIVKVSPKETLVDIGTKAVALAIEKERSMAKLMLSVLKEGLEVEAMIINPESDLGFPLVTLRRFIENYLWQNLEKLKNEKTKIIITIENKIPGGFLAVTEDGVSGFLPISQINFGENQEELVGKKIEVLILDIGRKENKIIFSQKALLGVEDFSKEIKNLKIGQKISAIVANITPFGIFISIPVSDGKYLDGLIHISEVSWDKVSNLEEMFAQGNPIEAQIIGFDNQAKRVNLSLKRLTINPFEEIIKKYKLEQKVTGEVAKIVSVGVILNINGEIEGLIRKEKIPPTVYYEVGDKIKATISEIDERRQRLILTPVLLEKPIGYK